MDLAGHTHSMKEFRGKVVVMDFGSRMHVVHSGDAAVGQVVGEHEGSAGGGAGDGLDSEREDAKFVAEAMRTPY